jgi:KDO2-lipid IV(A) lauroyltransferase
MTFQEFAASAFGTRLWMALGRWLPPRAGHPFANLVTGVLSRRRNSSLYRILCANQAGVLGPETPPERLDRAVRAVLRHAGFTAYDLMHLVALGEEAVRGAIEFGPDVRRDFEAARAGGRGVMICGVHLSNFNLAFLALALQEVPVQVLSSAAPVGGFRLMHDLRARGLLEETPIDAPALRAAVRRLREGGPAVTGVDWPIGVPAEERVPFFGRPARLPTGHIRLAISAGAVLLPVACRWDAVRGYYVQTVPPLELELSGDRAADVQHNARRVLAVCERWIAETPAQWLMYHPVWD